jgi:hypothetical protein
MVAAADKEEILLEVATRPVVLHAFAERQPEHLGLASRSAQFPARDDATKVGDRAGGSGHRNVVTTGDGRRGQSATAMQTNTPALSPARLTRHGDTHGSFPGCIQKPPNNCGAAVTDGGLLPAGESSRHPPSIVRKASVSNRVDPPVNPMQPAALGPSRDAAGAQASFPQLSARHHPVLSGRDQRTALSGESTCSRIPSISRLSRNSPRRSLVVEPTSTVFALAPIFRFSARHA